MIRIYPPDGREWTVVRSCVVTAVNPSRNADQERDIFAPLAQRREL